MWAILVMKEDLGGEGMVKEGLAREKKDFPNPAKFLKFIDYH